MGPDFEMERGRGQCDIVYRFEPERVHGLAGEEVRGTADGYVLRGEGGDWGGSPSVMVPRIGADLHHLLLARCGDIECQVVSFLLGTGGPPCSHPGGYLRVFIRRELRESATEVIKATELHDR